MENLKALESVELREINGGWRNSGTALSHTIGLAVAFYSSLAGFADGFKNGARDASRAQ